MSTVVSAPAAVSTVCDTGFCSTALNVVQPDLSTSATVAISNELSTAPVNSHKSFGFAYIVRVHDTDLAVFILCLYSLVVNDFVSTDID